MKEDKLEPLTGALEALQSLFDLGLWPGMILGGIAVSLLATPRFTKDVDAVFLLNIDDVPDFLNRAKEVGLEPRAPKVEAFARKFRVLLLRHKESNIPVDISMGILPFEVEAISRSQTIQTGSLQVRIPTPEDLIIFKAVAHRPQDMVDIQSILKNHPKLDEKHIRKWVKEFAAVLEIPEIYKDIKRLLKQKY